MKINSGDCFLDVFERVTLLQIASNNTDIYDDSTIKKDNNRSTTLIIIFAVVLGTLIPSIVIVSIFAYQKNIWCCKDRSIQYKEKQSQDQALKEKLKVEQQQKEMYAGGMQFGRHQIERKKSQEEFEIALREIAKQEDQAQKEKKKESGDDDFEQFHSVSYTHLTLPTKRIVQISVVAVF
eukprot:TRINITY_DN2936_c0_g1_i3.p2 TRINITY_DN2936_c0_g1~~TRINITY_DN2936_c0_g1_i3.p2  ORF type:complete len:180 (-),score=38.98 TRINITY_DN2936_c0_g1_i3:64-603(-)